MENNNFRSNRGMSTKLWIIIGILSLVAIAVVLAANFKQETNEIVKDPLIVVAEDKGIIPKKPSDSSNEVRPIEPGENSIIDDNQIVNPEEEVGRTEVKPMEVSTPRQTGPADQNSLPVEVIQLAVSSSGWEPAEFTVEADSAITISVSASSEPGVHILKFRDPFFRK